jgi:hypothetical protein
MEATARELDDLPSCECGTNRLDKHASPEREYTTLGAVYLLWGGTSVPCRVNFRCVRCGELFDSVSGRAQTKPYTI